MFYHYIYSQTPFDYDTALDKSSFHHNRHLRNFEEMNLQQISRKTCTTVRVKNIHFIKGVTHTHNFFVVLTPELTKNDFSDLN
jgi:hypothetical protein